MKYLEKFLFILTCICFFVTIGIGLLLTYYMTRINIVPTELVYPLCQQYGFINTLEDLLRLHPSRPSPIRTCIDIIQSNPNSTKIFQEVISSQTNIIKIFGLRDIFLFTDMQEQINLFNTRLQAVLAAPEFFAKQEILYVSFYYTVMTSSIFTLTVGGLASLTGLLFCCYTVIFIIRRWN